MLVVSAQAVLHCHNEALALLLDVHERAVQHCRFDSLSLESCQPAPVSSWRHQKAALLDWQELQFLRV